LFLVSVCRFIEPSCGFLFFGVHRPFLGRGPPRFSSGFSRSSCSVPKRSRFFPLPHQLRSLSPPRLLSSVHPGFECRAFFSFLTIAAGSFPLPAHESSHGRFRIKAGPPLSPLELFPFPAMRSFTMKNEFFPCPEQRVSRVSFATQFNDPRCCLGHGSALGHVRVRA